MAEITKVAYWMPVALDSDGTPLAHGERMVEIEPGVWADPVIVAAQNFIRDSIDVAARAWGSG